MQHEQEQPRTAGLTAGRQIAVGDRSLLPLPRLQEGAAVGSGCAGVERCAGQPGGPGPQAQRGRRGVGGGGEPRHRRPGLAARHGLQVSTGRSCGFGGAGLCQGCLVCCALGLVGAARRDRPGQVSLVGQSCRRHTDSASCRLACRHLEYKRPGGRAVRRINDTVRRRLWRRRAGTAAADAPAVAVPGDAAGAPAAAAAATAAARAGGSSIAAAGAATTAMAAAEASREAREAEAKRQAIKGFVSLVLDLLRLGRAGWGSSMPCKHK